LREIDRLGLAQAMLDQVVPRLLTESFVFKKCRPADANIGAGDDDTICMATELSTCSSKPDLLTIDTAVRNVSTTMRQPVFEIRLGPGASVQAG